MSELWIAVDADLGENDKVRALARRLFPMPTVPPGVGVLATEGLLVNLWGKLARYQEDGRLAERDDDQLEEWAKWKGEPGAFAAAFRELMTTDGVVTDWAEWQAPLIEYRRKERDRWHRRKEKLKAEKAARSTGASAESPPEAPPEPPVGAPPPDSRQKTVDQEPTSTPSREPPRVGGRATWMTPFSIAWQERYGGPMPVQPSVRPFRCLLASHAKEEVLRRWVIYLDATEGSYASAARFASTFGEWERPPTLSRNGRHRAEPEVDPFTAGLRRIARGGSS